MFISTYYMVTIGTIDKVERTYEGTMHICICARKRQNRQVLILSGDMICLAEHPAGSARAQNQCEYRYRNQVPKPGQD
jgi:hypothetical protein